MTMKKQFFILSFSILTLSGFAQVKKPTVMAKTNTKSPSSVNTAFAFKNINDSVSYAIGLRVAQNLKNQGFANLNMAMFDKACNDVKLNKKPLLNDEAINQCINTFQAIVNEKKNEENAAKALASKKVGMDFLTNNANRPGVMTTPSGLQYEVLKNSADQTKPTIASTVTCHYTGTLIDGTKFDSSVDRGAPATFPLANVIRGWQEGLPLMTIGSKFKFYIPAELGYGDNAPPNIGPGQTLIFEVELLGIQN